MDRVISGINQNRHDNRRDQKDVGRSFKEHAADHKNRDDKRQDQNRIFGKRCDKLGNLLGCAFNGHGITQNRRHNDQQHHHSKVGNRAGHRFVKLFAVQFPINKKSDTKRIENKERARLGRGKQTKAEADNQNDRKCQRPDAFRKARPKLFSTRHLWQVGFIAVLMRDKPGCDHQDNRQENTGQNAGQKQATDRNFIHKPEQDQSDAWWNGCGDNRPEGQNRSR